MEMGTRVAVMITQATRYGTFVCGGKEGEEEEEEGSARLS